MDFLFGCRELGIEAGVTAATYPPGPMHPHLAHYHTPPRLHHLQIGALPLMVSETVASGSGGRLFPGHVMPGSQGRV